ncbi:PT domain-containing protein [Streptomyces sp. NPDC085665]|uniref:PT domain-containing protein n=1 Tax=Streptomyces sp. NPDC085665 TaxID=3365735 RepID=UPI0037D08F05
MSEPLPQPVPETDTGPPGRQIRVVLGAGLLGAVLLTASLVINLSGANDVNVPKLPKLPSLPGGLPDGPPTGLPSGFPTNRPTGLPKNRPTGLPTGFPTDFPTHFPTGFPTDFPTALPGRPTSLPSLPDLPGGGS